MNINDYISSGILEQYVLGDTSPQEKQEVECMSHIYPEIQHELANVQLALEGLAMELAVEVPLDLKKNIFDAIEKEIAATSTPKSIATTAKVIAFNKDVIEPILPVSSFNKKYLVAAVVSLLMGSSAVYFILNNNFNTKETAFNNKIETLSKEKITNEQIYKNQLASLSIQNNKPFIIQGNAKALGKTLIVLWNSKTGNVYVNNNQLPPPTADKQYQLWALKDGKPIDLGVFNANDAIQNMKSIDGANAFAVTLETKGGSPSPHLEELRGIVNVNG